MSSRSPQSHTSQQKQKQQGGPLDAPSATRSTASTSRMKTGHGASSSFFGAHNGVARTEQPRSKPAFPAPSTIRPSESASRVVSTPGSAHTRSSRDQARSTRTGSNMSSAPNLRPATQGRVGGSYPSSLGPPPMTTQQYPPSAAWRPHPGYFNETGQGYVAPMLSSIQPPPASFASSQQRSGGSNTAPSAVRAPDNHMFGASQNTSSNMAPRTMVGPPLWPSQQNYARGLADGPRQPP